jgi:glycosyltransferase involved in cell wall biosynthesis
MQKNLVSVIMPVYNREKYVTDAIMSIINQSYDCVEVVVVNDGSTDGSLEIIQELERLYPNKIIVLNQVNQGQVIARNNAIQKCNGEFVAFLDSDDIWEPQKLELQIPLFKANVGLVYCGIYQIDDNGNILGEEACDDRIQGNIFPQLLVQNRMTGGTVVVRRDILNNVGVFDEEFKAAENWDLWLRVCFSYEAAVVNLPLVRYRLHDSNMSKDFILMINAKEQIISKHCSDTNVLSQFPDACRQAYADLSYCKGALLFSEHKFSEAKTHFVASFKLLPFYKDTAQRLLRCLLGKRINILISRLKR